MDKHVVVLGAGLAGLACGYELAKGGVRVTVLEREEHVGGMASSFVEDGAEYWCYDFGPHRFHSKDEELESPRAEVLDGKCVTAKRLSRIVLGDRFFDYPLKLGNVLRNLPPRLLLQSLLDYAWVRFKDVTGLEQVPRRQLRELGDPPLRPHALSISSSANTRRRRGACRRARFGADWASQRITLLNLADTVEEDALPPRNGDRARW